MHFPSCAIDKIPMACCVTTRSAFFPGAFAMSSDKKLNEGSVKSQGYQLIAIQNQANVAQLFRGGPEVKPTLVGRANHSSAPASGIPQSFNI